jgi:hypothetical protein
MHIAWNPKCCIDGKVCLGTPMCSFHLTYLCLARNSRSYWDDVYWNRYCTRSRMCIGQGLVCGYIYLWLSVHWMCIGQGHIVFWNQRVSMQADTWVVYIEYQCWKLKSVFWVYVWIKCVLGSKNFQEDKLGLTEEIFQCKKVKKWKVKKIIQTHLVTINIDVVYKKSGQEVYSNIVWL